MISRFCCGHNMSKQTSDDYQCVSFVPITFFISGAVALNDPAVSSRLTASLLQGLLLTTVDHCRPLVMPLFSLYYGNQTTEHFINADRIRIMQLTYRPSLMTT